MAFYLELAATQKERFLLREGLFCRENQSLTLRLDIDGETPVICVRVGLESLSGSHRAIPSVTADQAAAGRNVFARIRD
ncbi:hypothetical protein C4J81_18575 (plasmid) [Deltaproteobacteria bacterium Smac51]|nr:hypothetical protein C4J81_18575 [Deltaproteobacteria bacterium Smac51]